MDDDIRDRLAEGSFEEGFELLVDRYKHKVFRLAYSILGNQTEAEDAAQDIFLQIWKALPAFRGEASLSTWIYAITRNLCLSSRRKIVRHLGTPFEEQYLRRETAMGLLGDGASKHATDVFALLERLPVPYRQAVMLFYFEGKSYENIAEMLDLPMGTLKTYLHRARKQMAQAIKDPLIPERPRVIR